ncbi:MAG: dienelactone hydrolase family protein [Myxococcales bacterium]|nr:dienelactone hydrolase family protein [Myxococcales bacterium]
MIERVTFPSATGETASGALAVPADAARAPAVIVVHEWWGLTDQIERTAERLAEAGFVALAVDLYRGTVSRDPAEAQRLMTELPRERSLADLRGAVAYLHDHPRSTGKVAITGFCMGGAYAFAAACFVRGLSAAVPFYGIPPAPDWSQVDVPILAHVASRDGWVTPAAAEKIQETLAALGKRMDLNVYDADHAFMNEQRPEVYSAEDARVAWDRTIDFLRAHTA